MANAKPASKLSTMFAAIVIPSTVLVGILVYFFILGSSSNFEGGDPKGHPIPGNILGMMYKGGWLVPILIGAFLLVWSVFFERIFTLASANGKGSTANFIRKIQHFLSSGDINGAINECDDQKGSVANVLRAGLEK